MPLIDALRTTFKVVFSEVEDDLRRKIHNMVEANGGASDLMVNKLFEDSKGMYYYKFPATLESARLIKSMYKQDHGYTLTKKYQDFVMKLWNNDKSFRVLTEEFRRIKAINPDTVGHKEGQRYIIDGYSFKTMPWDHQKIGFLLMKYGKSIMLNWDMRTGKTFMVANYLQYLKLQGQLCKTLILAPMDILESTWVRDVWQHTELKGLACTDSLNAKRIQRLIRGNITIPMPDGTFKESPGQADYYVMNHDACKNPKVLEYILKVLKPDNLVIDEYHKFKTMSADRTKAVIKISEYIHKKNGAVVCMSGTPFSKDIRDGYAPSKITDPTMFAFSNAEFKRRFCIIEGGFHDRTIESDQEIYKGEKNKDQFKSRYQARSHRVIIQDCHDMPNKVETVRYVNMTKEQRTLHNDLSKQLMATLPDNEVLAVTSLTKLIKLVQVTGGYIYGENKQFNSLKKNPKLDELDNILKQLLSNDNNSVVLFTNFRPPVQILRNYLQKSPWNFAEMTTQSKTRYQAEWKFQHEPNCRVILAQPALCEGKDFSKANYAIFYDNNYKMIEREQADRRIFTPQSIKHGTVVTIDLMCRNSIDEIIFQSINKKKDFNADITKDLVRSVLARI